MSTPTPRAFATPIDRAHRAARRSHAPVVRALSSTALDVALASAPGTRHARNEDAASPLDTQGRLFVVADGVGGGALAAEASAALVDHLHIALRPHPLQADDVRSAILDGDRAIRRSLAERTDASCAATLALCVATDDAFAQWLIAWVGDCRAYRVRRNSATAELLTADDTYRRLNETPPRGGSLDDPARMVGNGAVDAPNVRAVDMAPADVLVLCSDGAHRHVSCDELGLLATAGAPLASRCERIVDHARHAGSHDDATVLLIERRV